MSRGTKQIAVVACLVAMAAFAFLVLPLAQWLGIKRAVTAAQLERTRAVVEKHPDLKPAFDSAMADGTLTPDEANEILGRVGEKLAP